MKKDCAKDLTLDDSAPSIHQSQHGYCLFRYSDNSHQCIQLPNLINIVPLITMTPKRENVPQKTCDWLSFNYKVS